MTHMRGYLTGSGSGGTTIGSIGGSTVPITVPNEVPKTHGPCWNCGYCPSCGRANPPTLPPVWPPYNPWRFPPLTPYPSWVVTAPLNAGS